jgi:spore photoproduct lyase
MAQMRFELNSVVIEEEFRDTALVSRVLSGIDGRVAATFVNDARGIIRPAGHIRDSFADGKRRMVVMRRRAPFLMGCPAGSREFACCGYLVLVLASNCPMDCSYCFLQEYVADNPALQIYGNYADAFDELDRLARTSSCRTLRIGTGELADSLAFDSITRIAREFVEWFARRPNLMLELKTKTNEIDSIIDVDSRGRTVISWTLSPEHVFASSEARTASPAERIAAARKVIENGYKVAFHLDPVVAYPEADADYSELLTNLFDVVGASSISFMSVGGLRMTPGLRAIARRRFPEDAMLTGEDVLGADGRYRAITPLRMRLFSKIRERIARANPEMPIYLCMENPDAHRRVLGVEPATPAAMGSQIVGG